MSYFNYSGKSVYYLEMGSGTPLCLLHGNTASSNMFLGVAPAYAEHYKVILIDFLGCGKSERVDRLPADLWHDQALQLIQLLKEKGYDDVRIIGSSGGAITAINAALEAPELISALIADSFEGEMPLKAVTENLAAGREASKKNPGAVGFYQAMNGDDWEQAIDCDTDAILRNEKELGRFFQKDLSQLKADILLTASQKDEFMPAAFFEKTYGEMLEKIGHGSMYLFAEGGHPAMMTNQAEFLPLSLDFFENRF